MKGYIERITGVIPYTNKTVDIPLNGRNLIITGSNGSGKTSFLRAAYEKTILFIVDKKMADLSQLQPIIPDNIQFSSKYDDRRAVVLYFEDRRLAKIIDATMAQGLQTEIEENRKAAYNQNVGNKLEQHLLNLRARRSFAITEEENQALADNIAVWFMEFEKKLKYLFEDDSAILDFNPDKSKFYIQQDSKPPYTFQTLSAGYRAIFDVYADLLMRTKYYEVSPQALDGVVFIDEIDSHLHISLQRLIFPFFIESFPNIQFIVATHSPFVLMSTRDTLVFDLGKEAPYSVFQVKSQNEILNDYLGVPTAMPVWAERSLSEILNKYLNREPDTISLASLKEELIDAGLEAYFPDSAAKILENK